MPTSQRRILQKIGTLRSLWFSLILSTLIQPASAQEPPTQAQNVQAGSRVFGSNGCVRCHAINGVGATIGPDLGQSAAPRSLYELAAAVWNHLPGMSGQMRAMGVEPARLAPWEAADLVAFLSWAGYFSPSGDTALGRSVFADKGCIVCHQAGGAGGVLGPALDFLGHSAPIQIAAAMWNHGAPMTNAMRTRGIVRAAFTGGELNDLIAFFESLATEPPSGPVQALPGRPAVGQALFEEKGCLSCHSVRGMGGNRAPDLGTAPGDLLDFAARMWNKAPRMTQVMREAGIEVPVLTAGDMADLVAYLASIQYLAEEGSPDRGRARLRDRGCLGCHALNGSGGTGAPDLAQVLGLDSRSAVIAALWNHVGAALVVRQDAWPSLSAADVADLSAILQTMGRAR